MKLGLHCYLFTDRWSDDCLGILDTAPSSAPRASRSPSATMSSSRRGSPGSGPEALGLTLTVGPGGLWPLECDLSADEPADRAGRAGLAQPAG